MSYLDVCEQLWQAWIAGVRIGASGLTARFDLDAAPEPYIRFGDTRSPLVIVTTNPGGTMDHQRRDAVHGGRSVLEAHMSYDEAAVKLGAFYEKNLSGAAALRVRVQRDIATRAGYRGVLQVECIPWHSANLPAKERVLKLMGDDPTCARYMTALREFLTDHPAIALSAVSTRTALSPASVEGSPWLSWQRRLLAIDLDRSEFLPLGRRGPSTTSAAVIDRGHGPPKAIVLMMGGNHWPGPEGRVVLAEALNR